MARRQLVLGSQGMVQGDATMSGKSYRTDAFFRFCLIGVPWLLRDNIDVLHTVLSDHPREQASLFQVVRLPDHDQALSVVCSLVAPMGSAQSANRG